MSKSKFLTKAERAEYVMPDARESRKQMEAMLDSTDDNESIKAIAKAIQLRLNGISSSSEVLGVNSSHLKEKESKEIEHSKYLSEEQESALLEFDPVLTKNLDRYCYEQTALVVGDNHQFHFVEVEYQHYDFKELLMYL
jgi:ribosomal protein L25 (general stress protein Ctc)